MSAVADALRLPMLAIGIRVAPGWTVGYVLVLLIAGAAPAASALIIGRLISLTAEGSQSHAIVGATVGFAAVFFVGQAGGALSSAYAEVYGGRLQSRVESQAIGGFGRIDVSGADIDNLTAVSELSVTSRQFVMATASYQLVRLQAVLPGLLLIILAPLPGILTLVAYLYCAYAVERQYNEEQTAAYAEDAASVRPNYLSGLALDLAASREIKVFRAADWVVSEFMMAADSAAPPQVRRRSRTLLGAYSAVLLSTAFLLFWVVRASLAPGASAEYVAVAAASLIALTQIFAVSMDVVYSRRGTAFFRRVARVLRMPSAVPTVEAPALTRSSILRFESVSFGYPGSDDLVIEDLSFSIDLGKANAIVGVNGAGKSTLVRLMTGIMAPGSGRITCDGTDISTDPAMRNAWRRRMSYLGQQYIRYPAPLASNVGLGVNDDPATWPPEVHDLLSGLDDRLLLGNTPPVLAKGLSNSAELSGGQWQRVATARAINLLNPDGKPRVLILDEPTAALDAHAESQFFSDITKVARGAIGTLMVSHRLAGIRKADEIFVLDDGRIRERGSHNDLMVIDGVYSSMFRAQAGRYSA